jgi:hypothetical protein
MRIWINNDEFEKYDLDINDPNFPEIAVNYIQECYFNGADSAIIYMGECRVLGQQEFGIMPN